MKVLAFDIGIKNLAYCLVDSDGGGGNGCVLDWAIINVAGNESGEKKEEVCVKCGKKVMYSFGGAKYCGTHIKTVVGKELCFFNDCKRGAMWVKSGDDNGGVDLGGVCTKHKPVAGGYVKYKRVWGEIEGVVQIGGKIVRKCSGVNKNGKPCKLKVGFRNSEGDKWYCKKHAGGIDDAVAIVSKKNANKIGALELVSTMNQKLDLIKDKLLEAEVVILENQPSLTNPIMKNIQSCLFQYFVLRGITDGAENGSCVKNVVSMNATNKLKVYKGAAVTKFNHLKNAKARRKKISIEHTKCLLNQIGAENKWVDMFNGSPKQDDLADAFLYCLYWVDVEC